MSQVVPISMAVSDSGASPSTEPMSETLDSDRPPAAAITSVVVTARTPSQVSFIDVTLGLTSTEAGLIPLPAPAASMMLQNDALQAVAVSVAPASTTTQHLQNLSKEARSGYRLTESPAAVELRVRTLAGLQPGLYESSSI